MFNLFCEKMKKFPVKIDLSTFFEDERKFIIILVDPLWKSVECLQHRVEEMFDVRPVHFLTSDNLFIPPQESIEVMEFTESLKAFIPKHALEESRRRSKKFLAPESQVEALSTKKESVKKRKYTLDTEIAGSSTPNQSKKTKGTLLEVPNLAVSISNESQEITSTNEQTGAFKESTETQPNINPDEFRVSNRKTSDSDILKNRTLTDKDEEGLVSISKRKRNRSHKRKVETEEKKGNVNFDAMQSEIPSSTLLSNSKSIGKNSHIYFDDSTIIESSTMKQTDQINTTSVHDNNSPKVSFKCYLNNDIAKPLVFPLRVINKIRKAPKPLLDIQENILLPPVNIDILTKKKPSKEMNNGFEKSVLSNTFMNTFDNANNMEKEDQLQSVKDDTRNNFEPTANTSILDNAKLEKDASITDELEETSDLNFTAQDIDFETMKERANLGSEINEKAGEKEISIEGGNNHNGSSSVNHSMTELVGDENKSQKKPSSDEAELFQKSFVKSTLNTTDASNNSMALEESCVIDLDEDEEDVIDLSDADDQQQSFQRKLNISKLSETLNKSISAMNITEMIPFCTPLTSMPALGDIVVFKFNRRNIVEKKDVSEFIACKCEHVNRRTKLLKLAILDASLEKDIIPQHYVYNLDESIDSRFMNIKFTEMIEAKVLKT